MNHLRALFLRVDHPLEADRMVFRHIRTHDQDRVGVEQIVWRGGGAASPEACAQTGHGRTMSYPGLVADAHHAESSREQFLNEVVFFIIERGAAQVADRGGLH